MKVKVRLSNLRTAPRKTRLVIDLVRGKKAVEAQTILSFTVNKTARPLLKLLNSAIATAKHDLQLDESNLFISEIFASEGPKLKRWHPMSRGRAFPIIKRSSHITLVLSEIVPTEKKSKDSETIKQTKTVKKPKVKAEVKPKKNKIKTKKHGA